MSNYHSHLFFTELILIRTMEKLDGAATMEILQKVLVMSTPYSNFEVRLVSFPGSDPMVNLAKIPFTSEDHKVKQIFLSVEAWRALVISIPRIESMHPSLTVQPRKKQRGRAVGSRNKVKLEQVVSGLADIRKCFENFSGVSLPEIIDVTKMDVASQVENVAKVVIVSDVESVPPKITNVSAKIENIPCATQVKNELNERKTKKRKVAVKKVDACLAELSSTNVSTTGTEESVTKKRKVMSTDEKKTRGNTMVLECARKNVTPRQSKQKLVIDDGDESPSPAVITSLHRHIECEDILDQLR